MFIINEKKASIFSEFSQMRYLSSDISSVIYFNEDNILACLQNFQNDKPNKSKS